MSESLTFSDRQRKSLLKKLNPFWWFLNDDNQTADQASWYHPEWPQWRRKLYWAFRNPLQNFRSYVLGVQDLNYTVIGRAPVTRIQRDDAIPPEFGWQWCVIYTLIPLPFASYSGERWVFQFGWQYNGFFAFIKINRK